MKVNEILETYSLTLRNLGVLIDVSPATMIYWQKTHNNEVPQKNEPLVREVLNCLEELKRASKSEYSEIVPLVLAFRQSPFWKSWSHTKYILTTAIKAEILDYNEQLVSEICDYVMKKNPGHKLIKPSPHSWTFDLFFKKRDSEFIGVFIKEKVISLKDILKELSQMEEFHKNNKNSKAYIFAQEIENSIRFVVDDMDYLELIEIDKTINLKFKKI